MTQQHQIPQPIPPQPPKRKQWPIHVAIIAGAVVVLLGAMAMLNRNAAPEATSHTVIYQADGAGTSAGTFTLETPTGSQQEQGGLPLKNQQGGTGLAFPGFHSGDFVYLSVQNTSTSGAVTCRIVVDGLTISENTSTGGYVIATCSGRVP